MELSKICIEYEVVTEKDVGWFDEGPMKIESNENRCSNSIVILTV